MKPWMRLRHAGFSLVELLTATVITLILAGFLVGISAQILDNWRNHQNRLRANFDVRVAVEMLVADLESAALSSQPYELLHSVPLNNIGTAGREASRANWLMFFAPALDRPRTEPGEVCAISYRLAFQDSVTGTANKNSIFALYRTMTTPSEAFNTVLGLPNIRTAFWDSQNTSKVGDLLVSNVVDFAVTFWYVDASGVLRSIDPSNTTIRWSNVLMLDPVPTPAPDSGCRLAQADISLTVLTREGSLLLRQTGMPIDEVVRKHSYTYVRRVKLGS